ncbi:MAG: cytochrome c biogenesis protein CcdA [Spirochaetota bacterium]
MPLSSIFTAILAAIFSLLSPCILPILPVYFSVITGFNIQDYSLLEDDKERRKKLIKNTIIGTILFILGFSIVFILLGSIIISLSYILKQNKIILQKIASIIIFLFGIFILLQDKILFLSKEYKPLQNLKFKNGNFLSSFLLGFSLSFGWTPCVSPFLGTILFTAAVKTTALKGFILLIIYCITLMILFIVIGLIFAFSMDKFKILSKKVGLFKIISGNLLILIGILMFFNLI